MEINRSHSNDLGGVFLNTDELLGGVVCAPCDGKDRSQQERPCMRLDLTVDVPAFELGGQIRTKTRGL